MYFRLWSLTLILLLAGCDIPGLGPDPRIALRDADGKAIGAACRHALRGIEDCYGLNERASKTAVFEGWKAMDQYMRENKIDGVPPKQAKAPEPEEVILEDKKSKAAAKDKASTEMRPKAETATAPHKALEKTVAKSAPP